MQMNKLNFKVWDKRNKTMSVVNGFRITGNRNFEGRVKNGGHAVNEEDLTILMPVGIKDKHNIPIYYDSDIVRYTGNRCGNNVNIAGIVILDTTFTNSLCIMSRHGTKMQFVATEKSDIEIIGTMQQNPELWEEKTDGM